MTKLSNFKCSKTKKSKCDQNSNVTRLKNSKCDNTKKIQILQNYKTQIALILLKA